MRKKGTFEIQRIDEKDLRRRYVKIKLDNSQTVVIDVLPNIWFLVLPILNRFLYLPAFYINDDVTFNDKVAGHGLGKFNFGVISTTGLGILLANISESVNYKLPIYIKIAVLIIINISAWITFSRLVRQSYVLKKFTAESPKVFVKLEPQISIGTLKTIFLYLFVLLMALVVIILSIHEFIFTNMFLSIIFYVGGVIWFLFVWYGYYVRNGETFVEFKHKVD